MKKLFLAFVALVSINLGIAQKLIVEKYLRIPAGPTLSAPHTTIPSDQYATGFYQYSAFGGVSGVSGYPSRLNGNFSNGMQLNANVVGTDALPYRFVNYDANTIIGSSSLASSAFSPLSGSDRVFLYGLSATAPLVIQNLTNSSIQLPAKVGKTRFIVQNAVSLSSGGATVQANVDNTGGRAYQSITLSYVRGFNNGTEANSQEFLYSGKTSSGYCDTDTLTVTHCFSYNFARESIQAGHANKATISHITAVLSGQGGAGNQTNAVQLHDLGPGSSLSYSIFDTSPIAMDLFTHGTKIHHNYFSFTTSTAGGGFTFNSFIGRTDAAYFAGSSRLTGDSLIIEDTYFNYTGAGTLDYLFLVDERTAPIIVRRCTFSSNITHIMKDNRAVGFTNTLTGDIGNNSNVTASITVPVYMAGYNISSNYATQGLLVTSSPYYAAHFGYRTPLNSYTGADDNGTLDYPNLWWFIGIFIILAVAGRMRRLNYTLARTINPQTQWSTS